IPKKSICAMPPRRRATSKARADSPSLQAATRAPVLLAVRCAPRRIARPVNDNREIDFTFDASRPVLSRLPFAAALWSLDRRRCALNHGAHRLLGFGAEDFLRCASLWVERIHPQDRDAFAAAWRRVESGETESASCHYRFLPRHRSALIHVGEFLFCGAPRADENTTVWSVYAEEADFEEAVLETAPVRELVQGMNHELGNSLQAIKGEVDLLRLAGALPPENAGGISRGIERIAQLAGELDEYLAPPPPEPRRENPETAVRQVLAARAGARLGFPQRLCAHRRSLPGAVARRRRSADRSAAALRRGRVLRRGSGDRNCARRVRGRGNRNVSSVSQGQPAMHRPHPGDRAPAALPVRRSNYFSQGAPRPRRVFDLDPDSCAKTQRFSEVGFMSAHGSESSAARREQEGERRADEERALPKPPEFPRPTLLVVDDDPAVRSQLERLYAQSGYAVAAFSSAEAALRRLDDDIDFVITDIKLPGMDGVQFIAQVHQRCPGLPVIAITGYADIRTAVDVLKLGACDFVAKPFDLAAVLESTRAALESARSAMQVRHLRRWLKERFQFGEMLSQAPQMHRVFELIRAAAPSDLPVLLEGEAGTGKELVAHAIHYHSGRSAGPLVAVRCAGLAPEALELELFGSAGAGETRAGKLAAAHDGTLFINEIEALPPPAQIRLLRALEERRVYPLGSGRGARVDARIIAASTERAKTLVAGGRLRADLYRRLN